MGALNVRTLSGEPVGVVESDATGVAAFVDIGPQFFWDTYENLRQLGRFDNLHDALVAIAEKKDVSGCFILEERSL